MERVSSNQTLFLKFFVPVFWIVFFGAFTLSSLFFKFSYVGNIPALYFRIGVIFFYVSGLLMFFFTLMRLVRVEMGPDNIYVTNYFKHVQYPYSSVTSLEVSRFAFLNIGVVELKEKGLLGKKLNFVVNKGRLED
ncbi:MAG: hypothetical protein AAF705_08990, partial [Bacteroidota bacterium]